MEENDTVIETDSSDNSSINKLLYSFPVDLTRREYIQFNIIMSKLNGAMRLRKGQSFIFVVLDVFCLYSILSEIVAYKKLDISMILLTLFIALTGSVLYFGVSAFIRNSAGNAYDQFTLNGNSYFGYIQIYENKIEKHGSSAVTSLVYDSGLRYIETKTMIILYSPNTPAIVLPARCLTSEDADTVRRVMFTHISAAQQKLYNRIDPLAKEHIGQTDQPESKKVESEQLYLDVSYTQDEFVKLATDTAGLGFMRALPVYSGLSILAALMLSFIYSFGVGLIAFILIIAFLLFFNVYMTRVKAKRTYEQMPADAAKIGISFTERGITIKSSVSHETIGMIWESVTRAVERPECVEFYTKTSFLRIPKHCIDDFELLKVIVDSHVHPASAK